MRREVRPLNVKEERSKGTENGSKKEDTLEVKEGSRLSRLEVKECCCLNYSSSGVRG